MLVGEDIGQISGVVKSVLFKGVHYEMMIDTGETVFKVHSTVMQPRVLASASTSSPSIFTL